MFEQKGTIPMENTKLRNSHVRGKGLCVFDGPPSGESQLVKNPPMRRRGLDPGLEDP